MASRCPFVAQYCGCYIFILWTRLGFPTCKLLHFPKEFNENVTLTHLIFGGKSLTNDHKKFTFIYHYRIPYLNRNRFSRVYQSFGIHEKWFNYFLFLYLLSKTLLWVCVMSNGNVNFSYKYSPVGKLRTKFSTCLFVSIQLYFSLILLSSRFCFFVEKFILCSVVLILCGRTLRI